MEKIKCFIKSNLGKDIWISLIALLVGITAFILGRLSVQDSTGINIQYSGLEATSLSGAERARVFLENNPNLDKSTQTLEKAFFASKRGKKYYSLECSSGKTIKPENRIYFETAEKAEQSGYQLSASCN